jgi:hypothetical protein
VTSLPTTDSRAIDFKKIEQEREATHKKFQAKYDEEMKMFDNVHGGRYDYDEHGYLTHHVVPLDSDTPEITMDMLRRLLKDRERKERTVIDKPELVLERPVPPITESKEAGPTPLPQQ